MSNIISTKRVTIMLDSDLETKIRVKQAELMKKNNETVSFSSVVNDVLRGVIKI